MTQRPQTTLPLLLGFKILNGEKATHSEVSHKDEIKVAAWAKVEKLELQESEVSEKHKTESNKLMELQRRRRHLSK